MRYGNSLRRFRRFVGRLLTALAVFSAGYPPMNAQAAEPVDVQLVLAIDCSYSVDAREYELQRTGLASAFRNEEVLRAIQSGPYRSIAVSVVQWSNHYSQILAIPWTKIETAADADKLAVRLERLPRLSPLGATSISAMLEYSTAIIAASPYQGTRQIIDVSGDGRNNNGDELEPVRNMTMLTGIIINGLAVLTDDPTLDYYFRNRVIAGPGAFVVKANSYDDYLTAITKKLLKEVRYFPIGNAPKPESNSDTAALPYLTPNL